MLLDQKYNKTHIISEKYEQESGFYDGAFLKGEDATSLYTNQT